MHSANSTSLFRPPAAALVRPLHAVLVLSLLTLGSVANGQTTQSERPRILLAGAERALWLARIENRESFLLFRPAAGKFDLGKSLDRRIAALAPLENEAFIVLDDGRAYRYNSARQEVSTALVLPRNARPIDLAGEGSRVFALVSSFTAAALPQLEDKPNPLATRPFEPGGAPYSIAVFDGSTWWAVASCQDLPSELQRGRSAPRLGLAEGDPLLFHQPSPGVVRCEQFAMATRQWLSPQTIATPDLAGFWFALVNETPTFVVAQTASGHEEVVVFRRLGGARGGPSEWRRAEVLFSEMPPGRVVQRVEGAAGFNQQLVLLVRDQDEQPYLRFGRFGELPAEKTVGVDEIFQAPASVRQTLTLVQIVTYLILLIVIAGLFIWRRGSMVQAATPPPGCELALMLQRLAAWAIDFVPFSIAAAQLLHVSWIESLKILGTWSWSADVQSVPWDLGVLLWWGLSGVGHTLYSAIMEALTGRTVGKVLLGTFVATEEGRKPAVGQLLARNGLRLLELYPPFWVFALLVPLSRNRQRMGDIFARTIVVRRARLQAEPKSEPDEEPRE